MWSSVSTQHSALSTQHSALSTPHKRSTCGCESSLILNIFRFFVLLFFIPGGFAQGGEVCFVRDDDVENAPPIQFSIGSSPSDTCIKVMVPGYELATVHVGSNGWANSTHLCEYTPSNAPRSFQGIFCGCALPNAQGIINCEESKLTLTPAPNQTAPRPKGTESKDPKSSTYELIAKVMKGSAPKAGVVVSFAVEVEPNTGGHDHHDASRPKGLVNGALTASGKTEANGEIKVTFQASEFAGTHVVAAACSTCTNTSATKNVDVKVPGLIELQGDYSPSAKYELIGNEKPPGTNHKGNHFFSLEAMNALFDLFAIFAKFDWGVLGVNDSSLKWGGRFDIAGHWNGSHHEHREGKEVDISFYKPFGTISEIARKKVYDDLFKSEDARMPNVLWHLEDNPNTGSRAHFHVYLLGQSSTRTTKY